MMFNGTIRRMTANLCGNPSPNTVAAQNNFATPDISIFVHKRIIGFYHALSQYRKLFTLLGYGTMSTREPL